MFFLTRFGWILLMLLVFCLAGCSGNTAQPPKSSNQAEGQAEGLEVKRDQGEDTSSASPSVLPTGSTEPMQTPSANPNSSDVKVKGIYINTWNMQGQKYTKILKLLDDTDLNAVVLDVKNDSGYVTYPSNVPLVKETGADSKNILPDMQSKIKELKSKGIYTIARLVVFKDPYLAAKKPEWSMQKKKGGVWRDPKGISWVDPFQEKVWDYNIAIAGEAAALGFDEVQFDYVRFPDNAAKVDAQVQYQNPKHSDKSEAIQGFLKRAKQSLPHVRLSADVFGLTTSSKDDMGIGQKWESIVPEVDIICPMIYPSHYSKGMYGIKSPDLQPYETISKALQDASERNRTMEQGGIQGIARIRPWLQDFTAAWVKPHQSYTSKQVREQIRAAREQGIEEFLLWNPSGNYSYR